MSRAQWGHGYHKGYKDAVTNVVRFVCEHTDDGKQSRAGIILEKHNDTYVVEYLDYMDMLLMASFGYSPSLKEEDVMPDAVYEVKVSDLQNPRFYYKWESVIREFGELLESLEKGA